MNFKIINEISRQIARTVLEARAYEFAAPHFNAFVNSLNKVRENEGTFEDAVGIFQDYLESYNRDQDSTFSDEILRIINNDKGLSDSGKQSLRLVLTSIPKVRPEQYEILYKYLIKRAPRVFELPHLEGEVEKGKGGRLKGSENANKGDRIDKGFNKRPFINLRKLYIQLSPDAKTESTWGTYMFQMSTDRSKLLDYPYIDHPIYVIQDVEASKRVFHEYINSWRSGATVRDTVQRGRIKVPGIIDVIFDFTESPGINTTAADSIKKLLVVSRDEMKGAQKGSGEDAEFAGVSRETSDKIYDLILEALGKSIIRDWNYNYLLTIAKRYYFGIDPYSDRRPPSNAEKTTGCYNLRDSLGRLTHSLCPRNKGKGPTLQQDELPSRLRHTALGQYHGFDRTTPRSEKQVETSIEYLEVNIHNILKRMQTFFGANEVREYWSEYMPGESLQSDQSLVETFAIARESCSNIIQSELKYKTANNEAEKKLYREPIVVYLTEMVDYFKELEDLFLGKKSHYEGLLNTAILNLDDIEEDLDTEESEMEEEDNFGPQLSYGSKVPSDLEAESEMEDDDFI